MFCCLFHFLLINCTNLGKLIFARLLTVLPSFLPFPPLSLTFINLSSTHLPILGGWGRGCSFFHLTFVPFIRSYSIPFLFLFLFLSFFSFRSLLCQFRFLIMSVITTAKRINNGDKMEEEAAAEDGRGLIIADGSEFPLSLFSIPRCYSGDLSAVLIPHGLILDRIQQLAREIHSSIGDRVSLLPLILLCVLKGSYRFFTALVDRLSEFRHQCRSPLQVEFIRARSYLDQCSMGEVAIQGLSGIDGQLRGANILLVDDISDTGQTMARMTECLEARIGPEGRVWTAVLLCKRTPKRREEAPKEDFVAFSIPDKFIVGFGLDYNQMFRELAHICVLSAEGAQKYKSKTEGKEK